MRVIPRFTLPRFRSQRELWRRCRVYLSVSRVAYFVEMFVVIGVLVWAFAGKRPVILDGLGRRGDLILVLGLLALFVALHSLFERYLLPHIELYFAPTPYDESRIFFDLGQGLRNVASIDQLYQTVADRIRTSLEASNVSIFVRDDRRGDYYLRVSSLAAGRTGGTAAHTADTKSRLAAEAFVVRRLRGLTTPLQIGPAEFKTWSQALRSASEKSRAARLAETETLQLIECRLLVQIKRGDQLVGVLSVGSRRGGFDYSDADKELLISVAAQLALVIENAQLTERLVAEERLRRELALAAEVQQRLLPARPPDALAVELAGFCEPARGVGGDYYDFIAVDPQQLGVAIADVAGKGMPAALVMSTVQATLRSLTARNGTPISADASLAQMVTKLNRLLFNSTSGQHLVTFFYANFDQTTHRLTYVNAGHNPPLYVHTNGSVQFRELTQGGLIAGVFEQAKYDQETVQMESNDLLFMYTDGLTEALNRQGEEFGEARVKQTLADSAKLSVKQIRDEVVRRVNEWCLNVPLHDDLTFVVMKVK